MFLHISKYTCRHGYADAKTRLFGKADNGVTIGVPQGRSDKGYCMWSLSPPARERICLTLELGLRQFCGSTEKSTLLERVGGAFFPRRHTCMQMGQFIFADLLAARAVEVTRFSFCLVCEKALLFRRSFPVSCHLHRANGQLAGSGFRLCLTGKTSSFPLRDARAPLSGVALRARKPGSCLSRFPFLASPSRALAFVGDTTPHSVWVPSAGRKVPETKDARNATHRECQRVGVEETHRRCLPEHDASRKKRRVWRRAAVGSRVLREGRRQRRENCALGKWSRKAREICGKLFRTGVASGKESRSATIYKSTLLEQTCRQGHTCIQRSTGRDLSFFSAGS